MLVLVHAEHFVVIRMRTRLCTGPAVSIRGIFENLPNFYPPQSLVSRDFRGPPQQQFRQRHGRTSRIRPHASEISPEAMYSWAYNPVRSASSDPSSSMGTYQVQNEGCDKVAFCQDVSIDSGSRVLSDRIKCATNR